MTEDTSDISVEIVTEGSLSKSLPLSLLTSKSEYFRALAESGMKEIQERKVKLPAITDKGLQIFAEYLYGQFGTKSVDDLNEGLNAAVYLQAKQMQQMLCEEIMQKIDVKNCDVLQEIFSMYSLYDYTAKVEQYRKSNIVNYSKTDQFLKLDLHAVCCILSNDDLNVQNEKQILNMILHWLKCNGDKIKKLCANDTEEELCAIYKKIINVVRFPIMQTNIVTKLFKEPLLNPKKDKVLISLINDGYNISSRYCDNHSLFHVEKTQQTTLRNTINAVVSVGGFSIKSVKDRASNIIELAELSTLIETTQECINFKQNKKMHLSESLCENGACVLDNVLYIAGGQTIYSEDGRYTTNKVYRLHPLFGKWEEVSSMKEARSLFYFGAVGQKLYAVSGWKVSHTMNGPVDSVEQYDIETDQWSFVKNLEGGKMGEHAGCNHNNELYISGGFKGPNKGHLDKLWKYVPSTDEWITLAPMTQARSYHAMESLGDRILVAGGVNYVGNDTFEDVLSCEVYDPDTNQWAVITQVPRPSSSMSSILHQNKLYLIGGHSFQHGTDHNNIAVLDINNWTWTIKQVKSKVKYSSCVVLDLPKFYLDNKR